MGVGRGQDLHRGTMGSSVKEIEPPHLFLFSLSKTRIPCLLYHHTPHLSLPSQALTLTHFSRTAICPVFRHRVGNLKHLALPILLPFCTHGCRVYVPDAAPPLMLQNPSLCTALFSSLSPPHCIPIDPSLLDPFGQGKIPGPTFHSSWHLHLLSPRAHFHITLWFLQAGFYAHCSTETAAGKAPTNSKRQTSRGHFPVHVSVTLVTGPAELTPFCSLLCPQCQTQCLTHKRGS